MKRIGIFLALAAVTALASSCSYKHVTYLQDIYDTPNFMVQQQPDVRIREGDKLSIVVSAKNPLLAAQFNSSTAAAASVVNEETGEISTAAQQEATGGYTVDKNGQIMIPILGKLTVLGMTPDELKTGLEDEIRSRGYINDPIVTVELTNFKILMMGEFGTKGMINVPGNTINIFEAIALAGDLTENARRDNIKVIRADGNMRTVYRINVLSTECYDSPVFYLQQNDFVYAEPRRTKLDQSVTVMSQFASLILTALSTVSSILVYLAIK